MKICKEIDFSDLTRECWSGALDTLETIEAHDKEDMFMQMLEENFEDNIPTLTEINDLLWFDDEWIFEMLGIDTDSDDDDDEDEGDDDDVEEE